MNKLKLIVAIFIAATLTACGKSSDESSSQGAEENGVPTLSREALRPLNEYIPVSMGSVSQAKLAAQESNMRALFWNGAPLNYDALAGDFVPEYKDETDTFKRSDLAKANKDKLDAAYKLARQSNRFSITFDKRMGEIKKYDPAIKGFSVWPMETDSGVTYLWDRPKGKASYNNGYWGVRMIGGGNGFNYIPASEDEARALEAKLAQRRGGRDSYDASLIVYGRVVGYDKKEFEREDWRRAALFLIDGISFVDHETKEILLTVDKKSMPEEIWIDPKITADYFDAKAMD